MMVLVTVLVGSQAYAQPQPTVAVVDLSAAVLQSEAAQARQEAFRESPAYTQLEAKLESAQADLQNLLRRAESPALSGQQRGRLQERIDYISSDLDATARQLQQLVQRRQQAIFDELTPVAREAVDEVMGEAGVDISISSRAILYGKESLILTSRVTERINQKLLAP